MIGKWEMTIDFCKYLHGGQRFNMKDFCFLKKVNPWGGEVIISQLVSISCSCLLKRVGGGIDPCQSELLGLLYCGLMKWNSDIQQTSAKVFVADTKRRANIPSGLYRFMLSEPQIASVNHEPLEMKLVSALRKSSSLTFIVQCLLSSATNQSYSDLPLHSSSSYQREMFTIWNKCTCSL